MSGHTPWREIRRKHKLPPPGKVDLRYLKTGSWQPLREGSIFDVLSFSRNEDFSRFPEAVGFRKKLYLEAVAKAFARADMETPGICHPAIRFSAKVMVDARERLLSADMD